MSLLRGQLLCYNKGNGCTLIHFTQIHAITKATARIENETDSLSPVEVVCEESELESEDELAASEAGAHSKEVGVALYHGTVLQ